MWSTCRYLGITSEEFWAMTPDETAAIIDRHVEYIKALRGDASKPARKRAPVVADTSDCPDPSLARFQSMQSRAKPKNGKPR